MRSVLLIAVFSHMYTIDRFDLYSSYYPQGIFLFFHHIGWLKNVKFRKLRLTKVLSPQVRGRTNLLGRP